MPRSVPATFHRLLVSRSAPVRRFFHVAAPAEGNMPSGSTRPEATAAAAPPTSALPRNARRPKVEGAVSSLRVEVMAGLSGFGGGGEGGGDGGAVDLGVVAAIDREAVEDVDVFDHASGLVTARDGEELV